MKKVLCIGDCCADTLIPYGDLKNNNTGNITICGGGTVANTCSGLARLGVKPLFLGNCGNDQLGKNLKRQLEDDGADVKYFKLRDDISTPQVLVIIDENRDRFPILMPKVNKSQLYVYPQDLDESLLDECDYIHTTGFMFFDEGSKKPLCDFLSKANKHNVKVCLDANLRVEQANLNKTYLLKAIEYTNYLFVSVEDDLIPLTGIKDITQAAKSLVNENRCVIAKNGINGSTIYTKDNVYHQDIFKVDVVDTLGAGDAYNSGFLYALANDLSLIEANKIASATAAINSTQPGARNCPTEKELLEFIKRYC